MHPTVLRAMLLMLLSTALLACMHGLVRYVSDSLHPFEIAFFRNLFGFAAVLPLLLRAGLAGIQTHQPGLQLVRSLIGICAMLGWFYGLSVVPIAGATALSFSSAIFASIGAALFLRERMRLRRWTAVIIGFMGALIVLRPGVETISIGALAILFSSMCWGGSIIIVKRLGQTDSTVSIVVIMSIMMTLLSFIPALLVWQWPSVRDLILLLILGSLGSGGHLAMVSALKLTDATQLMPLDFTRLIWTSLLGYFAFAEVPDIWTWIGGTLIFSSAAFITYRESKLKQKALKMPKAD